MDVAVEQRFYDTVHSGSGLLVQGNNNTISFYSSGQPSETEAIENWLSPCNFDIRQVDFFTACIPSVGEWLLKSEAFASWATGGRPWCLRCHGEQGSGKTVLSSIVVHHLQTKFENEKKPVIYLYLDYQNPATHVLENLFGSLLKQLISLPSAKISSELQALYRRRKGEGAKRWQEIFQLLSSEILTYERVYVIVDALDECPLEARKKLQQELQELQTLQPGKLSLMMTARESTDDTHTVNCDNCGASDLLIYFHCDICNNGDFDLCERCREKGVSCKDRSHRSYEPYGAVEVEIRTTNTDMKCYIESVIRGKESELRDVRTRPNPRDEPVLSRYCREDPEHSKNIVSVVTEKAEGNLLFARLYMDQLQHAQTVYDIKETLASFPKELDEQYEVAMKRIINHKNRDNRDLALEVLSRITLTCRPLTLAELQDLLATSPGDTDLNTDKHHSRNSILSATIGLIGIVDDDPNTVVRLLHLSLSVYLRRTHNEWFPEAEIDIANACLTYLAFNAFSRPCQDVGEFESKKKAYPFIAYASQHWGDHAHDANPDPNIEAMSVKFLGEPLRVTACVQAAWSTSSWGSDTWDVCIGVTDLHMCAWFGLSSIASTLWKGGKSLQIDVRDMTYQQTPLMYACRRGQAAFVHQLLDRNADVNAVSARGRTAMFEAVIRNQEKAVEVLLAKAELDINTVQTKEFNHTALMLAAIRRQFKIVSCLLTRSDIDPNIQDLNGCTALYHAVKVGSIETVQALLLDSRTDLNRVDEVGRSALFIAAILNNVAIAELLLEKHADSSLRDKQGQGAALLRAVDYGSSDVVELMLGDADVDVECLDTDDRGLFHGASINGNAAIIRLLGDYDIDINTQDKNGLTALHDASREGHLEAVETLLKLEANANLEDRAGRTPLRIALQYGRTQIATILREHSTNQEINRLSIADSDSAPVWLLVSAGHSDLAARAIATPTSDLCEQEPISQNTALHFAVLNNQLDTMRLLLLVASPRRNGLDLPNRHGRTPLHLAAINGLLAATLLLLQHHPALNPPDQWGHTPAYLAQCAPNQPPQNFPLALALLAAGADPLPLDVQKLFFAAVRRGCGPAVPVLLRAGADLLAQDADGRRAVELARDAGDAAMERLLLSSAAFRYVDAEDKSSEPAAAPRRVRPKKPRAGAGAAA